MLVFSMVLGVIITFLVALLFEALGDMWELVSLRLAAFLLVLLSSLSNRLKIFLWALDYLLLEEATLTSLDCTESYFPVLFLLLLLIHLESLNKLEPDLFA